MALLLCVGAILPSGRSAAGVLLQRNEVLADVPVLTFERAVELTPAGDGCAGKVQVWPSADGAREGRYAACWTYAVQQGTGDVLLRGPVDLPGRPQKLRLWVRGNGCGLAFSARLRDAEGHFFRLPLGRIDFVGWRSLGADIGHARPEEGQTVQGDPAFPLQLAELRIEGVAAGMTGVLHLDAVTVTTWLAPSQQTPLVLVPASSWGVFRAGEPVALTLQARNLTDRPVVADVSWRATDQLGRLAATGVLDLRLSPSGEADHDLKLPISAAGVYTVTAEVRRAGMLPWSVSRRIALVPPRSSARGSSEPALGVCVTGRGDAMEHALVAAWGARWVRQPASWSGVEREPGDFAFPTDVDDWIAALPSLGARALVALECQHAAYDSGRFPESPMAIAALARFCQAAAQRWGRAGPVRAWEIEADPGADSPSVGPAGFVRALRAVRAAIREADPNALLVAGLTDGSDLSFLDGVLRAGGAEALDVVGVQFAVPAADDVAASLAERLQRVQRVLQRHGASGKPIWVTRLAVLASQETTEADAAGLLARAYVEIVSQSQVRAVFWNLCNDAGAKADSSRRQAAGWMEDARFPGPALLAVRAAADQLEGVAFQEDLERDGVCCRRFAGSEESVVALWSRQGELLCAVHTNEPRVVVVDAMGNARTVAASENVALVPVTTAPCYVRLNRTARVAVRPVLSGPQGVTRIRAGEVAIVAVSVHRPFRTIGMGAMRVEAPPGWRAAVQEPGLGRRGEGEERIVVRVGAPVGTPGGGYSIRLAVDFDRAGLPAARLEVPVCVDPER